MIPQTRKYFVIVVHFGAPEVTSACLESLAKGSVKPEKVIVVDHAAEPYQPESVAGVHVIRPSNNGGYAGGLNLGLGAVVSLGALPYDIVICCNNDVVFAPDSLQKIHEWVQVNEGNFLAGPSPAFLNYATGRAQLVSTISQPGFFGTPYLHGSCLVAPLGVYAEAQGLPEDFHMYWEDVAFSARAVTAGARLKIIPNLKLSHPDDHPVLTNQLLYLVRNGAWYLEHQLPPLWRVYWYIFNRLRYIWHQLAGKQHVAQAIRAALKNNLGPIKKASEASAAFIGAIVVTHNNQATLTACLHSLQKANIKDIVVVDNASTDDTLSRVPSHVTVIKNKQNNGFGAAANQGAQTLENSHLLFLNPDAELQSSLEQALQAMNQDSRVGIVGLGLYDKQGKLEPHSFGAFPTLTSLFFRKLRHLLTSYSLLLTPYPNWVSAGALIVRKEAWQELGGFDPAFFMYWEDVDLCYRARKAGWLTAHLPHVRVSHERGASLPDASKKTRLYDDSADRYFKKHYPWYIWGTHHYWRWLYRGLFPRGL